MNCARAIAVIDSLRSRRTVDWQGVLTHSRTRVLYTILVETTTKPEPRAGDFGTDLADLDCKLRGSDSAGNVQKPWPWTELD